MKMSLESKILLSFALIFAFIILLSARLYNSMSQSIELSNRLNNIVTMQRKVGNVRSFCVDRTHLFEDIVMLSPSSPFFKSYIGRFSEVFHRIETNINTLKRYQKVDHEVYRFTTEIEELHDRVLKFEKDVIIRLDKGEAIDESKIFAIEDVHYRNFSRLTQRLAERVSHLSNEQTAKNLSMIIYDKRLSLFMIVVMMVLSGISLTIIFMALRERKHAEEALQESRDYIDNIIESMIDTLIVIDSDARIKTINNATSDLLGYKEDELIGRPVATIFAEEEEEEEEASSSSSIFKGTRLKKLIEEGTVRDYDMKYCTKKGEVIPVSFSGSVMRDKEGELVGIVGIARDMREIKRLMEKEKELAVAEAAEATEKKKSEELRALNQQLRASEQQQKAANQQLRASEQQLKASNQQLAAKEQALRSSQKELRNKVVDLERFNRLMVGRELQMIKLKGEVNSLLEKLGEPNKYEAPDRIATAKGN